MNSVDNSVSTFKVITLQHPVSRPRNAATSRAERRAQTSPTSVAKRPKKLNIMEHWERGLAPHRSTRCQTLYGLMDAAAKLQARRVQAQRAGRDDAPLLTVADTTSTAILEPPVLVPSHAAPMRVLDLPEEPRPRVFKTYDIPVLQTSSSLAVAARGILAQDLGESSARPLAGSASSKVHGSKFSNLDRELLELAGEDMDEEGEDQDRARPLQMEDLDDVELDLLETLEDYVPCSRCTTPEPPESGPVSQPASVSSFTVTVGDEPSYNPRRVQRRRPSSQARLSLLFTALFASNRQKAQLADLQAKQLEQAAMTTDSYDDYSARADEENLWMNTEPLEHENEREVSRLPSSSYPDALGAHSHSQHDGGGEEDMDIDSDESGTSFSIYCDVLVGYTQHETSFCRGKENSVTTTTSYDSMSSSSGESSTSTSDGGDSDSTCVDDADGHSVSKPKRPLFDHLLGTHATYTAFEPRHRKYSVCLEDFRYVAKDTRAGGVEYVRCRVKDDDGWAAFTNLALAQGSLCNDVTLAGLALRVRDVAMRSRIESSHPTNETTSPRSTDNNDTAIVTVSPKRQRRD
ncbi:hypothetical protein EXIGLDRAFT_846093 [Exidia glandulosa HHB12029]|uniref:Uncharacterized protein n=1 Tax=Exidia glandulosa HHB12029 TaxID=1314781 RepID=A0A165B614_EXIGL|nr:hypothetical protein EXIGLDRAFT_846093 [Exidia glandulosa HHB12029]